MKKQTLESILAGILVGAVTFFPRECDDLNEPDMTPLIFVNKSDLIIPKINLPDYEFDKYEFYRRASRNIIGQLSRKHKIWPPGVVVSDEKRNAYYDPGKINVSISLDLFIESVNDWYFASIHEFGHHKYFYKADKDNFTKLYFEANIAKITGTFKEGLFDKIPVDFGHPVDAPTELYASAFTLSEAGLINTYKSRFFPLFSEEHKQLAEKIFEEVRK